MSEWSTEPIFNSSLAVWVMAGALAALLTVGPRFGKLSPRRRWMLMALRATTILLVLLAMLRPTRVFTSSKPRSSVILAMLDFSRSMELPHSTSGESRWDAQKSAVGKLSGLLPQFGEHTEVQLFTYDAKLEPLKIEGERVALPERPLGLQTDIGGTLEEALRRLSGKRVAAVLLMGDGRQTAFNSSVESAAAAKRVRDEFAAPLYATPFGPTGDVAQAKDVAIERLDEQYTVFVKNEVVVRGRMKIAGYAKEPIPVELSIVDLSGKEVAKSHLSKSATVDGEAVEFEFPHVPESPGHYKLTVKAALQQGELVTKNNELSAYLTVLEGGLRVLAIDSGKRPEFKFLRRSLNDSPDIELDDVIIDSLNQKSWPVNLGDTLTDGKYDVFILGNVPAEALGQANMQELANQVGKGKGLLMTGGVRTFGAGNYYNTPLATVLPIIIDRFEKQDFAGDDRPDLFLPGPIPLMPTSPHAITRLAEGADNATLWQQLPPLDFSNKFSAIKASPGVRVLLSGPQGVDKEPLLVSGEFGSGRVLAFAGESTYRWSLKGMQAQHKRFWRQSILWLARRDESQQSDVWVKLPQRRFQAGGNVHFTLGARSPEGDVVQNAQFTTTLVGPDGKPQAIRAVPGAENWSGNITAKEPGDYAIEVLATKNGQTLGKSRAEFMVFDQDVELSNAAADHEHLARLASITKEFGGRLVAAEELGTLLEEIANRPPEMEVRQQKWRLGDNPLGAWTWLLSFVSVLGVEWWLRKRWGLV